MGSANTESSFSTIESPYCWHVSNLSRGGQPPTPIGSFQSEGRQVDRNPEKKGSRKAILTNIWPHITSESFSQVSVSSRVEASLSERQPKLATTCLLGCSSPSQRFITTLVQEWCVSGYFCFREPLDKQVSVLSSFLGYRQEIWRRLI